MRFKTYADFHWSGQKINMADFATRSTMHQNKTVISKINSHLIAEKNKCKEH